MPQPNQQALACGAAPVGSDKATATASFGPAPAPAPAGGARATSFGAFKPVGHVMLGLPSGQSMASLQAALCAPGGMGCASEALTPLESAADMQALIDNASPLAGFGYELTLMRRYLALAQQGTSWLVVKVADDGQAQRLATLAKAHGATLAVHYGKWTVEELI